MVSNLLVGLAHEICGKNHVASRSTIRRQSVHVDTIRVDVWGSAVGAANVAWSSRESAIGCNQPKLFHPAVSADGRGTGQQAHDCKSARVVIHDAHGLSEDVVIELTRRRVRVVEGWISYCFRGGIRFLVKRCGVELEVVEVEIRKERSRKASLCD